MRISLLILSSVFVGCTPKVDKADSDNDGLTDAQEEKLGSDPNSPDSDGDGLMDKEEKSRGTSPVKPDTDGDGYTDYQEAFAGTDPLDEASVIYQGGWPFNTEKDSVVKGDPAERRITVGSSTVPPFILQDQFGEMVDVYDFANQGKPMILDLSGAWCFWCQQAATMLTGGELYSEPLNSQGTTVADLFAPYLDTLPELVHNGDIYWLTVLDAASGGYSVPPTERTISAWAADFPDPEIPVLMDADWEVRNWIKPDGWPTMMFVDENMVVQAYNSGDYTAAWDAALEYAGQ